MKAIVLCLRKVTGRGRQVLSQEQQSTKMLSVDEGGYRADVVK